MLRKRNIHEFSDVPLGDDDYAFDDDKKPKSKIVRALHRVDLFQKTPNYVSKRTYLGAFLSFVTILFVCFLVISEFMMYMKVKRVDTLSVDLEKGGKILIYFNISFPSIKCSDLSVDSVDASGDQHINIYHRMRKNPIAADGTIVEVEESSARSPFYCGPCYLDSRPADGQCCNTCDDVLNLFKRYGRTPPPKTKIEQCVHEMTLTYPGCNMFGAMEVNKVAGNFHFAPGRSFSQEHETRVHHIHEFNPILASRFNTSHIINELSFGERIPHVTYPLDGVQQIIAEGTSLYKYFIKVVPTAYKRGTFGSTTESYQFSFTKHHIDFDPTQTMMLPGIFFVYDLSPIKISYHDTGDSFLHFIVSMCAVVGGVFVVSGYIDRMLHKIAKVVTKKAD